MDPFLVSDALRSGHTRGSLRSTRFEAPFFGVRATSGSLTSIVTVCQAYAKKMPPGSVFSGLTAAQLWEFPLPTPRAPDVMTVEVSARAPRRAPRGVGVHGSQRRPDVPIGIVHGLPVLSPAETWWSLSAHLTSADLTAAADHLLSDSPFARLASASRSDLEATFGRHRGAAGSIALRRALQDARIGSWSRPEALLRLLVASVGLPEPRLNLRVGPSRHDPILDLAWPEFRFGVEYDGDHHRARDQFAVDVSRQERVHDRGWMLMRATRVDLFDRPSELVERVHRRLTERGCRGVRLEMSRMVRPAR